jgi:hypothetical protein
VQQREVQNCDVEAVHNSSKEKMAVCEVMLSKQQSNEDRVVGLKKRGPWARGFNTTLRQGALKTLPVCQV